MSRSVGLVEERQMNKEFTPSEWVPAVGRTTNMRCVATSSHPFLDPLTWAKEKTKYSIGIDDF